MRQTESLAHTLRSLAQLLALGVSLPQAAQRLGSLSGPAQAPVQALAERLRSGSGLARAMEQVGPPFDRRLIRAVEAAEKGGELSRCLNDLADMLEGLERKKRDLRAAMAQPWILGAAALALMVFLCHFILPTFVSLFEGMSLRLPLPTQLMIAFTKAVNSPPLLVSLVLVSSPLVLAAWWLTGPSSPIWLGAWLRRTEVSDWLRWLGYFLEQGMALPEAVSLAAQGGRLSAPMDKVAEKLRSGSTLEAALKPTRLPAMASWLVVRAERSGFPAGFLSHAADALGRETEVGFARSTDVLQPLAVVGIGGVVAFIIISVFLPLYQLIGNLG